MAAVAQLEVVIDDDVGVADVHELVQPLVHVQRLRLTTGLAAHQDVGLGHDVMETVLLLQLVVVIVRSLVDVVAKAFAVAAQASDDDLLQLGLGLLNNTFPGQFQISGVM